ncbi:hypothetical protein J6590_060209 [Homalodisca vitripennis]|nr:hypothetical protein J6590_060209 [Homalodisca vitripennis]
MVEPNEESLSSLCRNLAFSTIWWTVLYFALVKTKIWGQQSAEFYCRIVTVVHAVTVVTLSVGCYWQGPDPYKSPGERNTLLQDITLEISLGYFLYDLGWSLYHQTEPAIMILHHVVSVISIGTVLFTRTSGGEAVAGILSLEMTNPLLQMRWFLRTAGYNNTLAHTIVELLFVAMFLVMRLGLGSAITYCVVTSPKPRRDVKFCTLSLYLISLAFIFYIFQFIRRKYIGKKSND